MKRLSFFALASLMALLVVASSVARADVLATQSGGGQNPPVWSDLYAGFVQAFDRQDPEPIIRCMAPDFTVTMADGRVIKRTQYEKDLREAMGRVVATTIAVERVRLESGQARVYTTERQTCRVRVSEEALCYLHVEGTMCSTWVRAASGWQLKTARILATHSSIDETALQGQKAIIER